MHEMSLCEGIVQVLEEQAATQRYDQVKTVWLEIGELAGIELEAMRFGFDVVRRNTIAENARLEITRIPGQAWCMACAETVEVSERFEPCPVCGGYELQVTGGDKMRIKELEVE